LPTAGDTVLTRGRFESVHGSSAVGTDVGAFVGDAEGLVGAAEEQLLPSESVAGAVAEVIEMYWH
jgi:hypothetical protein